MKANLLAAGTLISAIGLGVSAVEAAPVQVRFGWDSFTSKVESPASVPAHVYIETDRFLREVVPVRDVSFTVPISSDNGSVEFYTEDAAPNTRNRIFFTPNPSANVGVGELFRLGTFSVTNGVWFGDADLRFTMLTVSSDPALNGFSMSDTLRMRLNPFNPDPALSADSFYLVALHGRICAAPVPNATCSAGVRVYELFDSPIQPRIDRISNGGTFELWGKIGSLVTTDIRNTTGAAFLDPIPIAVVSEPGAPTLLLLGLVGLAARLGLRKRA